MAVKITAVAAHSPAAKKGLRKDDLLLSINDHPIRDVLDYQFYALDTRLQVTFQTAKGKTKT
ncbi:MAG: PDZ domain-containing protein, partial [Clostridia bacterium]|nr:PDZ domain-containing protein [Clostridia bacterium]